MTEKKLLQILSEKGFDSITEPSKELERGEKNVSKKAKKPVFGFDEI